MFKRLYLIPVLCFLLEGEVSGATTLKLKIGRNIPPLSASMAFMGDSTLTVIISFGKLMPIISE